MEWTGSLEGGKEAPLRLDTNAGVVLRGGCYDREPKKCSAVYRWVWPGKTTRVGGLGFRCAKDAF
jgi:formylglycine-generating enzyme required for sulfatase activity